jgi:hypothetical protein
MSRELATDDVDSVGRRAHDEGVAGDFRGFDRVLEQLSSQSTPEARAWVMALSALRWHAEPHLGVLPDEAEIRTLSEAPNARPALGLACAHAQRAALLAFDWPSFQRLATLHRGFAAPEDAWAQLGDAWLHVLRGADTKVADGLAKHIDDPALVLEAATLRAMEALSRSDLDEATTLSRRASRMARTEAFPQAEYLANTVLAHVRRMSGQPHLAARILSALLSVAPATWQPWLTWELLLAQGTSGTKEVSADDDRPAAAAVRELRRLLACAEAGDVAGFDDAHARVAERVEEHHEMREDLRCLVGLLDPRTLDFQDPPLEPWCSGEVIAAPRGLGGIAPARPDDDADRLEVAYVLGGPRLVARRVLSVGLSLVERATNARHLPPGPGRQARTESTLAALVLAGRDGVQESALFLSIYGFEYEPAVHQNVRNTLYHRIRSRLGDLGELERADDVIRVNLLAPLLIPDPRCSPPPEVDLLRVLARWGHASAREAAEHLGIPLRTAQKALRRLADDGACRREQKGRHIVYHLEDTTFAEPTRH